MTVRSGAEHDVNDDLARSKQCQQGDKPQLPRGRRAGDDDEDDGADEQRIEGKPSASRKVCGESDGE